MMYEIIRNYVEGSGGGALESMRGHLQIVPSSKPRGVLGWWNFGIFTSTEFII